MRRVLVAHSLLPVPDDYFGLVGEAGKRDLAQTLSAESMHDSVGNPEECMQHVSTMREENN